MIKNFDIVLIDAFGEEIVSFHAPSDPFNIGDIVNVEVENNDPNFWDKEPIKSLKLELVEKDSYLRFNYSMNKQCYTSCIIEYTVVKISQI